MNIHPESDCPGCERCIAANVGRHFDALHVIPAHLAGESDICGKCRKRNDALSKIDRGDEPAGRAMLRALDAPS
jgi:hypothetical protein